MSLLQEDNSSGGTGSEASGLDQDLAGSSDHDTGDETDGGTSDKVHDEELNASRQQNGTAASGRKGKASQQQQQQQQHEDKITQENELTAAAGAAEGGAAEAGGLETAAPSRSTSQPEVTSWAHHVTHALSDAEVARLKAGGAKFTTLDLNHPEAVAAPPAETGTAVAAAEAYKAGWKRVKWQVAGRDSLPPAGPHLADMGVKERVRARWMELQEQVGGGGVLDMRGRLLGFKGEKQGW